MHLFSLFRVSRLAGRVLRAAWRRLGGTLGAGAHGAVRQFDKYRGLVGEREGIPYYIYK